MKRASKDELEGERRISRRGLLLAGLWGGTALVLVWRMRDLQLERAEQFRMLAEENRIATRLIAPARGLITDRHGVVLAGNEQNYRVVIIREAAGDPALALRRLGELIPLSEGEIERALREMRRNRPFVPVTVTERLSWDDFARVAANAPALPGIVPEVGLSRVYPFAQETAHVVGYVGPISEADLANTETPDPLLLIPRFPVGKVGVERAYDSLLRGQAGYRRIEVNALGREMRELSRQEGLPGKTVTLTIDRGLQAFTLARLSEQQSAAAAVIEIATGNILALASSPSFDPNLFVRGITTRDFEALTTNPFRPLLNKAVQGAYPPGSTFKMVTALAALEAGLTTPEERIFCPGHMEISGQQFHCWKRSGHGRVNLVSALSESCDVYFYELAQRAGIDRIHAMAEKLGLGIRYDLPLQGMSAGLNPSREWKREARGQIWRIGDTINAAIGQGYVLATPLQLAVMCARLASNLAVTPRLVQAIGGMELPAQNVPPLGLSTAALAAVRRGMSECVNHARGTAYGMRIVDPALRMAGKTGTSQVFSITPAERAAGIRRQEQLPWNRRDHALFVAYAPEDAPRYAVAVVVEHGGGGSGIAAPIARDILLAALVEGMPPVSAYPSAQRHQIETLLRTIEERIGPIGPPPKLRERA